MLRALSIPTSDRVGSSRSLQPARLKSTGYFLQDSIGILTLSDTATTPIPCNPCDISGGLHGIRWAGLPSHLPGVGFSGWAIEPLRRPFSRDIVWGFHGSLGRRVQADLVDTFTLLLMAA